METADQLLKKIVSLGREVEEMAALLRQAKAAEKLAETIKKGGSVRISDYDSTEYLIIPSGKNRQAEAFVIALELYTDDKTERVRALLRKIQDGKQEEE